MRYFLFLTLPLFLLGSYCKADLLPPINLRDIEEIRRAKAESLTPNEMRAEIVEYKLRLGRLLSYSLALMGGVESCADAHFWRLYILTNTARNVVTSKSRESLIEEYVSFFMVLKLIYEEFDYIHTCRTDEGYRYSTYGL